MGTKPSLFIGSSIEHLDLAYAIQEELEHDVNVTVWSQGVFKLSKSGMTSLIETLDETDFGIFVLAPDDIVTIRDSRHQVVRDNVIFELGLFIGGLGVERSFIVTPRGNDDLHLPTDLVGVTSADFDADREDGNMRAALGPACNRIRKAIGKLGKFEPQASESERDAMPEVSAITDVGDIKALLQSWMGARTSSENKKAIRYSEVDRELGIEKGSTEKYIAEIATKWRYRVAHKGGETILFEKAPPLVIRDGSSWMSR